MEMRKVSYGYEVTHPLTQSVYWVSPLLKEKLNDIGLETFYLSSLRLLIRNGNVLFEKRGEAWGMEIIEIMLPSQRMMGEDYALLSQNLSDKIELLVRKYGHIKIDGMKTFHDYAFEFLCTYGSFKEEFLVFAVKHIANYDHVFAYCEYSW